MITSNYTPMSAYDDDADLERRRPVPRSRNGRHPNHYGRGGSRNFFEQAHRPLRERHYEEDRYDDRDSHYSSGDWHEDDFYQRRHHADNRNHYGGHYDEGSQPEYERNYRRDPRWEHEFFDRTAERAREAWHDRDYDRGWDREWDRARNGYDGDYRRGINRGWENSGMREYEDERNHRAGRPRHHYYDEYRHRDPAYGSDYYGTWTSRGNEY